MENLEADLIKRIQETDEWDMADCAELCAIAGLTKEWEESDEETFEAVIDQACEILGISIY